MDFLKKNWLWLSILSIITIWLRIDIWYNSPYLDECDYLFVGRLFLEGNDWPAQIYMFSSQIPLYIFGIADMFGGYISGRLFAVAIGIISLIFYWKFSQNLLDDDTASIFSVLFFAMQASHIFISKFVTYDIVCFGFFSIFLFYFSKIVMGKSHHKSDIFFLTVFYLLALLSKYVVIIYAPFIFLLLVFKDWKKSLIFASMGIVVLLLYYWINADQLQILYRVQLQGTHGVNSSYSEIIEIIINYTALPILVIIFGVNFLRKGTITTQTVLGLLVVAIVLPLYHLFQQNMISFYKHLVYSLAFISPICAYVLEQSFQKNTSSKQAVVIFLFFCMYISYSQVKEMENSYPNTDPIISYLDRNSNIEDMIMSEDPYLLRYYFYPKYNLNKLIDTRFDNDLDGVYGEQDIIDACWDGKFNFVVLHGLLNPNLIRKLRSKILNQSYERVIHIPFNNSKVMNKLDTGFYDIYRLKK